MNVLLPVAVLIFLLVLLVILELEWGLHHMRDLAGTPFPPAESPLVSILFTALNEEKNIEQGIRSLLALEYDNLEVIAVNDRSTDSTGMILDRLQQEDPRLRVIHISDLPDGWLGKNNALYNAAGKATGEYLLFTDADVVMEKTVLSRAMQYMITNRLDHLSLMFDIRQTGSMVLNTVVLEFAGGIFWTFKPWKVKTAGDKHYMGVGAFNLITSKAYEAVGTHKAIAMCPVDDIALGKKVKEHGFSQDCLLGGDFLCVPWYQSLSEMVIGLEKNIYAGLDFNFYKAVAAIVVQIMIGILPLWAVFFTGGATRLLFTLTLLLRFMSFAWTSTRSSYKSWHAIATLITPYITTYITIRAVSKTLYQGGIYWRGTFYSLKELKKI